MDSIDVVSLPGLTIEPAELRSMAAMLQAAGASVHIPKPKTQNPKP